MSRSGWAFSPAWTLLSVDSFNALRHEPLGPETAIRLREDVVEAELLGSYMVQNSQLLLRRAVQDGGLKLTATGNLTRAAVAEMIPQMEWPAFDKADMFRFNKVINEPDFPPLHIVRTMAQGARLLRGSRGKLIATKAGRGLLPAERQGSLLALLFRHAFWRLDLSSFGRGLLGPWPQNDIGVVLWSLSVSANSWQSPEGLARLCTIPINGVLDAAWDVGSTLMEARILRPLLWLGLLEHRYEDVPGSRFGRRHLYRKTPLFDGFMQFDVSIELAAGSLQ